jgi:hypothetical protein
MTGFAGLCLETPLFGEQAILVGCPIKADKSNATFGTVTSIVHSNNGFGDFKVTTDEHYTFTVQREKVLSIIHKEN